MFSFAYLISLNNPQNKQTKLLSLSSYLYHPSFMVSHTECICPRRPERACKDLRASYYSSPTPVSILAVSPTECICPRRPERACKDLRSIQCCSLSAIRIVSALIGPSVLTKTSVLLLTLSLSICPSVCHVLSPVRLHLSVLVTIADPQPSLLLSCYQGHVMFCCHYCHCCHY
jgi:hypothetical protein